MKHNLMFTLFTVLTLNGVLLCRAGEPPKPTLDQAARERIIAGANDAIHKHLTGVPNGGNEPLIRKENWGEAISALKPLRVLNDKVNVFIILKEDATTEEGLYVWILYSSYAPSMDKRFLQFEKMSEEGDKASGTLYRCKRAKAEPASAGQK
jgi:hypothetical protein